MTDGSDGIAPSSLTCGFFNAYYLGKLTRRPKRIAAPAIAILIVGSLYYYFDRIILPIGLLKGTKPEAENYIRNDRPRWADDQVWQLDFSNRQR